MDSSSIRDRILRSLSVRQEWDICVRYTRSSYLDRSLAHSLTRLPSHSRHDTLDISDQVINDYLFVKKAPPISISHSHLISIDHDQLSCTHTLPTQCALAISSIYYCRSSHSKFSLSLPLCSHSSKFRLVRAYNTLLLWIILTYYLQSFQLYHY